MKKKCICINVFGMVEIITHLVEIIQVNWVIIWRGFASVYRSTILFIYFILMSV